MDLRAVWLVAAGVIRATGVVQSRLARPAFVVSLLAAWMQVGAIAQHPSAVSAIECAAGARPVRHATENGFSLLCERSDGTREGPFATYFGNGQKATEGAYRGNELDGRFQAWYANGRLREQGTFLNGKKEGPWIEWYESGSKAKEGAYKEDEEYGLWKAWYANGQIKEEGEYRGRMPANGRMNLRVPRREGPWTFWYENGKKRRESQFRDGAEYGVIGWFDNGRKASEDTAQGVRLSWYENGQKASEVPAGVGTWTEWHRNGRKKREGQAVNGKKTGAWSNWDEAGNLWEIDYYEDGRLVRRVHYRDGKAVE
jgi:uncharacterized protein